VSVSGRFFWQRLLTLLPGALLPLLLFGIVIIVVLRSSISAWTDANNRSRLLQTQDQIELIIGEMDSLNITFSVNFDITSILMRSMLRENYNSSLQDVNKLTRNYLIPAVAARPYVHSLYIYMDNPYGRFLTDTDYLVTLDKFYDTSWYESYQRQKELDRSFNSDLRDLKRYSFEKQSTQVITLYKRFFLQQGVVVLNLNKKYFDSQLQKQAAFPDQQLLVLSADGQILMQSTISPVPSGKDIATIIAHPSDTIPDFWLNGLHYQITRVTSDLYGWTYLSMTPLTDLYALPNQLVFIIILAMVLMAVICLIYSVMYAKQSRDSIMKIFTLLEAMEHREPLPAITPRHNDAYTALMHNIIKNFASQNELRNLLEQKKVEAKMLELTALRAQINPHFLFNTLQSIYWLSFDRMGGPNDVSSMIENMTDILQYSMDSADDLVPLSLEIKNTQEYISLQHMRYQQRFLVEWEIDDDAKPYYTIKLLLQPLIENAIQHGINWDAGDQLHISIRIKIMDGHIRIVVKDDGMGIPQEKLNTLLQQLEIQGEDGHIGLANCHRRLRLTFGPEYGLELVSENGLQISFRLPKITGGTGAAQIRQG
jgi:two-component system sensor histidine kinase YesM